MAPAPTPSRVKRERAEIKAEPLFVEHAGPAVKAVKLEDGPKKIKREKKEPTPPECFRRKEVITKVIGGSFHKACFVAVSQDAAKGYFRSPPKLASASFYYADHEGWSAFAPAAKEASGFIRLHSWKEWKDEHNSAPLHVFIRRREALWEYCGVYVPDDADFWPVDDVSEERKSQIKTVLLAKNYSEHAAQQFVDNPENFKQGAIKCVGFDNALYQALVDKKAEQH